MNGSSAFQIMQRHARSFAPAARLLARPDRDRVATLYALCRTVDDLADEDGGRLAASRLARIENEMRTRKPVDPVAEAALRLFDGLPDGSNAFADLVSGVRSDQDVVAIKNLEELTTYAHLVAGTVGVMVCVLFDVPSVHHTAASALGQAMQLTNICRDVLEDARAGRRYLPHELCPHAPEKLVLAAPAVRHDVVHAVRLLLSKADELYAQGMRAVSFLPVRLRLSVVVAAALYRDIGHALLRIGGDPLDGRVRLGRPRKIWLAMTAVPVRAWRAAPWRDVGTLNG